jgi:hypothetical protein
LFVCCLVGLSAASAGCARRHRQSAAFRAACVRSFRRKGSALPPTSRSPPATSSPSLVPRREYPRVPIPPPVLRPACVAHHHTCARFGRSSCLGFARPAQSSSRPLGLFDACGTEPPSCRAAAERGQLDALFALGVQLLSA